MFLDLPIELQEKIYDNLEITDRVNLNIALPRNSKIIKTTKTNKEKDKRIGLLNYYFKKKNKIIPRSKIYDFVLNNKDDPTCKIIYNSFTTENVNEKNNILLLKFEEELKDNKISNETLEELSSKNYIITDIMINIFMKLSVVSIDTHVKLLNNAFGLKLYNILSINNSLFYYLIIYENENLLKFMIDKKDILELRIALFNNVKSTNLEYYYNINHINLLIKYFDIEYIYLQRILEKSIENQCFTMSDYLMKEIGVLL
jgi:hypothetical protein